MCRQSWGSVRWSELGANCEYKWQNRYNCWEWELENVQQIKKWIMKVQIQRWQILYVELPGNVKYLNSAWVISAYIIVITTDYYLLKMYHLVMNS